MTWQLGLILTCLSLFPLWLLAEWWESRGMRRRARKRASYAHYCELIGRDERPELIGKDVKWMGRGE